MWKQTSLPDITAISAIGLLSIAIASTNVIAQDHEVESAYSAELAVADVMVSGEFVDFSAHVEFERAVVRISGPNGYSATIRVPAGTSTITADLIVDAQPAAMEDPNVHAYASEADGSWHTLPDGEYRYELVMVSGDREIRRQTGDFRVVSGTASDDGYHSQSSTHTPTLLERIAGATLDFLIPSANASNTFNSLIVLDDHDGNDKSWVSYDNESFGANWRVGHDSDDFIWAKGAFGPPNARMTLVDSNEGSLGIGTTNPQNQLHVARSGNNWTAIRIENSDNHYLLRSSGVFGFEIRDEDGQRPFRIETEAPTSSLRVQSDGNVGIGTPNPSTPLHVSRSGSGSDTDMFRLENNDGSRFQFANTRTDGAGGTWEFINTSSPGGADLVIRALHNAGGQEFRLTKDGDLTIRGSLTEGSSRAIKSNIVPLSGSAILSNLAQLEFAEWSYDNSPDTRHAGPMAEDFHEVFGLGPDNKHIAPRDLAGLALAAAQALREENQQLKERLSALEQATLLNNQ